MTLKKYLAANVTESNNSCHILLILANLICFGVNGSHLELSPWKIPSVHESDVMPLVNAGS